MTHQTLKYYHMLKTSRHEFKWHLRDQIFQMQTNELKNMRTFNKHMKHIRRGCAFQIPATNTPVTAMVTSGDSHKTCHVERKKLVLNRTTVTTITSLIDPQPKTNASKLSGVAKPKRTQRLEEDPSIINVDMVKFFSELAQLIRSLDCRIFNCKLQQMNIRNENNVYYFLRCDYDSTGTCHFFNRIFSQIIYCQTKT